MYLATVIDIGTRRLVGYSMAERMRAELVIDALTRRASKGPARSIWPPIGPTYGHKC